MTPKKRPEGQSCLTCGSFHHCDPGDEDGFDGYCCDPMAPGSNVEYGGHWANSGAWCRLWVLRPSHEETGP
jgi:hypothetical protein